MFRGGSSLSDHTVGFSDDQREVTLHADELTDHGGPAKLILELGLKVVRTIETIMPSADAWLTGVQPGSMKMFLEPSPRELEQALARRRYYNFDPAEEPTAATDTSLAVSALGVILSSDDVEKAAVSTRGISAATVDAVRGLSVSLVDAGVSAVDIDHFGEIRDTQIVALVEQLDRVAELKPEVVPIVGVLQGANSSGEGRFEIKTDERIGLSPYLGNRRRPGDTVRGTLTQAARAQIRDQALWDRHVEASIEIYRRQRGQSIRIEGIRLLGVAPRYSDGR